MEQDWLSIIIMILILEIGLKIKKKEKDKWDGRSQCIKEIGKIIFHMAMDRIFGKMTQNTTEYKRTGSSLIKILRRDLWR